MPPHCASNSAISTMRWSNRPLFPSDQNRHSQFCLERYDPRWVLSAALCQPPRLRSSCAKIWSRPQPSANWRRSGHCQTRGNNSVTRRLDPAIWSRVDGSPSDANSENCRRERLHPAGRAALQSVVLREQVHILYESPVVLLVSLNIVVLIAFSLRGFYPGWLGVAWAGRRYFGAVR